MVTSAEKLDREIALIQGEIDSINGQFADTDTPAQRAAARLGLDMRGRWLASLINMRAKLERRP